jgi:hypothetical protein
MLIGFSPYGVEAGQANSLFPQYNDYRWSGFARESHLFGDTLGNRPKKRFDGIGVQRDK